MHHHKSKKRAVFANTMQFDFLEIHGSHREATHQMHDNVLLELNYPMVYEVVRISSTLTIFYQLAYLQFITAPVTVP